MNLRCWNGGTCRRDCLVPCKPYDDDHQSRRALTAPLDWRRLFKAYMAHVLHKEGVTHVRWLLVNGRLTSDERAAILEIEAEVKRENPDAK